MSEKQETTEHAPDVEERGLQAPSTWFLDAIGGQSTSSGIAVNSDSALTMSAVYACVRVLAETIASLPVVTYSKTVKGKTRDEGHPAFMLLRESPNAEMSSYSFIETMMTSVLLGGNAYAEIQRDRGGSLVGLHFIPAEYVTPSRTTSGRLVYRIRTTKVDVVLEKSEILHFAGLSTDGIIGLSPIGKMREAIGMGLATQEFGANFFKNATRPSGILETPTKLTDDAVARLRDTWRESFQGSGSTGSVPILEQGLTWKKMTIDPEDAQFLSTRRFQTAEIARAYRVPLYLLADMEAGSSYSSIEQVSIDFARYSLRPWLVRLEHELNRKLFRMAGDSEHFVEFLLDAILRADTTTRFNAYKIGRDGGWLSINDIRKLENMDAIESDGADQYLQPLNMTTVGDIDEGGDDIVAPEEARAIEDVDTTPTLEMAELASEGLKLRAEYGRGGTEVGVARARDIKNRASLSPETVRRMASYFARHRVDLEAPAASRDHPDYPSAGVIAWMLWGGDPSDPDGAGAGWAERKSAEIESESASTGYRDTRSIERKPGDVEDRIASRRSVARRSLLPVFEDALSRILRVETNSIRRQVTKLRSGKSTPDAFATWVARYYAKDFPSLAIEVMTPSARSYAEAVVSITEDELGEFIPFPPDRVEAWVRRFAARMAGRSLRALDDAGVDADALANVLESWDAVDLESRARNEMNRLAGSALVDAYRSAGVERVVWRSETFSDLDGKVVRTGEPFLERGDMLEGSGGFVFNAPTAISHPPLTTADRSEIFAYFDR